MEPVTTAMVLVYLADLGAGVAADEVTAQLKHLLANRSRRRRIAKATANVAAKEGIHVKPAVLREWLRRSDVQQQLVLGTHESVETAITRLAWALEGTDQERAEHAVRLVEITCQQYLLVQSPQEATAVSAVQTQALVSAEHQTTREATAEGFAEVINRLDAPAVFEENLTRLHPWRAESARQLAESWSSIHEVVDLIARSRDRRALLATWAVTTPIVLADAPGGVWCWMGELARDYGCDCAAQFITRGIERGVPDPDYWWARAALATDPEDEGFERSRRDLLQHAHNPHPLGRAQLAFLDSDWNQVDEALAAWEPATRGDASIKAILASESFRARGELDFAIGLLEEASLAEPDASGLKVHLAELLLSRGYRGHTVSRTKDFAQAQALAIQARDARRLWGGDSVKAALVAIKASAVASDLNRTWQLTQTEPGGNATSGEATDPRIRREAAVLAAMTGRTDEADQLAASLADSYTTELVAGYHALNNDDLGAAEIHWLQAWDVAPDDFSRLQVARSLAPLGLRLPDLDDLAADHPDLVAETRAIHDVMATGTGQRLTKLRAHAPEYEQIAVLLAQELSAQGDLLEAGEVLDQAATRWDLPLLRKMAADRFFHGGEYKRAVHAAQQARTMAGASWPGEVECLGIEFNALEALGREDEALAVVRQMTNLAPESEDARWALVNSLGRRGNLDAAFAALRHKGVPIRPRNREEARNWIILLTACDRSPYYLSRALDELDRWSDDEETAGVFLTNITFGLTKREGTPDPTELGRLHTSTDDYVDKFPESPVFRRFTISEDDPLGDLAAVLKKRHTDPALQELQAKVASAELPVGLAAEVHGVSYAEASLKRAAGFVYSNVPGANGLTHGELLALLRKGPAVLDTTAAVSILALGGTLREQLVGQFTRLESTGMAFRDARASQRSLSLKSTMSMHWDAEQDRLRLTELTVEEADTLAERADQLVALLTTTRRQDWQLRRFTELTMEGAWVNLVDYAVSNSLPFWCDDIVLRGLARQEGCTTFGTIDLIQALEATGDLDASAARTAQATLLVEFHALLEFDHDLFVEAAQLDDWRARGVAAALTLPETWSTPVEVMKFVHQAAGENAQAAHDELRGWVAAAATGLAKIGADANGASQNLSALLGSFLARPWMTPRLLPVVVEAVRQALRQRPDVDDPLHGMLVMMYRLAAQEFNESAGSHVLLHWAEHLEQTDKHDATMIAARRG
ncbi:tetratricopeptide (TPR) repeat protein [Nocardioides massiliensis]|uniref:Tetratricopeptide (TPR) repeat protein n=2 Tax=Nocardioides massiliensis TaxID=1325935 RepID=A0ABT9NSS0_9ACTN|nr:hypothetical protein [Nocardioides massiliensis]MDP9823322.1 tetratricopeptide (TPR) repeat protein [Nocardioides massiliensis]